MTGAEPGRLRGYFAIGAEGISKPYNLGNLMRSAHAFGASFFFTIDASARIPRPRSDTSRSPEHLPCFAWETLEDMNLPSGCQLVGVEFLEDATDLPSFRHPRRAAYVFGSERGTLSPPLLARCEHIVKIPSAFCVNVATAGAIVMYDRVRTLGRFPPPPVCPGGPAGQLEAHAFGPPISRRARGGKGS
jgi:tRNA G18 (ribose-2'-O)-methylase SpoU